MSLAGLEVDGVEPVSGHFTGVVVGRVESIEPHPDAKKLNVCSVFDGTATFQVVCGAPNVVPGMVVPFAKVGASLPGGLSITERELRGVASHGMLCGASELEVSVEGDGLWDLTPYSLALGDDVRDAMNLNDRVLDIDLTPNRGDCLSVLGIARDVGALTGADVKPFEPVNTAVDESIAAPTVSIHAQDGCANYHARIIEDVNVKAASPLWLTERLRRSGIRSIDPVVDVTNYTMLLLGQPMHAFDADTLSGAIAVRWSTPSDTFELLDGSEVTPKDTLLIADEQGPLAVAGIMGGLRSSVREGTSRICLESACFLPPAIAGKARNLGLATESSHRFERGVDPNMAALAMEFATNLIIGICGGRASTIASDRVEGAAKPDILLRKARLNALVGTTFDEAVVENVLSRLGFSWTTTVDGWSVAPLSFRYDVSIEEDLIEEVVRVHGYHNIPVRLPKFEPVMGRQSESKLSISYLANHLVSRGFRECVTYSFISEMDQQRFDPQMAGVRLSNPISAELAVMRTSILPGLINTLKHNLNHGEVRFKGFETGLVFQPGQTADGGLLQRPMLAGVMYGAGMPVNWNHDSRDVDFYDLKGEVESLLQLGRTDLVSFEALTDNPAMHPGQSAVIRVGGEQVGFLGVIHPAIQGQLDLAKPCLVFEIQLEKLVKYRLPSFKTVSRFPGVDRDLAFLVSRSIPADTVMAAIEALAGEDLRSVIVFDVYEGESVPSDQRSIAFRLHFRNDRDTLVDADVNAAVDKVVTQLTQEYGAKLRD